MPTAVARAGPSLIGGSPELRVEVVAVVTLTPEGPTVRLADDISELLTGVRSAIRAGVTGRWIITTVAETIVALRVGLVVAVVAAAATGGRGQAIFELHDLEPHLGNSNKEGMGWAVLPWV